MVNNMNNFIDISVNQDNTMSIKISDSSLNSIYCEIEDLSVGDNNYEYSSLHINIHSLPQKLDLLKMILLRLEEVNIKIDFIMLCETYLTDDTESKYDTLKGYKLVAQNRKTKTLGGISSADFTPSKRLDLSPFYEGEFETIFAQVRHKSSNKTLLVGEIYRVPNTNAQMSIDRFDQTLSNITREKYSTIIIGTDQNFDYLQLHSNNYVASLFNTFVAAGMFPTISKPTQTTNTSSTIIDNIYINGKKH